MDYWHFTKDEKEQLIGKLTNELHALHGVVGTIQDELANAIGVSRQTNNAIEIHKRDMP